MYNKAIKVLTSRTVRQSAITSASTIITAGLGAVYYLLMARFLGPEKYGIFSLAIQIMLAITPLADLGTGTAIVRFIGEKPDTFKSFTSAAFKIKAFTGLLSIMVLVLSANFLAKNVFHQPSLGALLPITGVGVLVFTLFNYSTSVLQGLQKFTQWGAVQIAANIVRLILLGIIFITGIINPAWSIIIFIFSFVFGIILSWKWLDRSYALSVVPKDTFKEFWRFNKWTALFTITASITSRLDAFYTARYLDIAQTGIYSLAITMSSFLPQFASAFGAVTAPKFSGFKSRVENHNYLKKALPFAIVISSAMAILMIPASLFVIWFTGRAFSPAFIPFLISLLSMVIFASSGPIRDSLLYAYKKPQIIFVASIIQGIVIFLCGKYLIVKYGIAGAAVSSLLSQVSILIMSLVSYKKISQDK